MINELTMIFNAKNMTDMKCGILLVTDIYPSPKHNI